MPVDEFGREIPAEVARRRRSGSPRGGGGGGASASAEPYAPYQPSAPSYYHQGPHHPAAPRGGEESAAVAERVPLFHSRGPQHGGRGGGGGRGGFGGRSGGHYHPHQHQHHAPRGGRGGSPYGRHHHHHHHPRSSPYGPSKSFFGGRGGGGGSASTTTTPTATGGASTLAQQPHPSERYLATPMLCGYLWKQENAKNKESSTEDEGNDATENNNITDEAKEKDPQGDDNEVEGQNNDEGDPATNAEEANGDENNDLMNDDDDKADKKKEDEEKAYTAYRRQYCETYLKHIFNAHLDDSWFRQLFSPLGRYQNAEWERQRAQTEAKALLEEIQEWQPNPLKHVTLATTLSLSTDQESPRSAPRFHVPRAVRDGRLLQVQKVPPHVTNTQLWHALPPANRWIHHAVPEGDDNNKHHSNNNPALPAPDTVLQLISSMPQQTHHTRTVYWLCPNKATAEALWQAFLSLDGRPSDTTATVPWEIDCPDPYRRTEYDVDGRGGAPEDGLGVPDRKAVLSVAPHVDTTAASVLSMSLSDKRRIPEDARAATTLARALDVQQHVPAACQLDSLLETAESTLWNSGTATTGEKDDDVSSSLEDPQALRLDLALAYLRRVHHVNFYKGCQRAEFWGDVLAGHEAASSLQYRTVIRPEDEDQEEEAPVTAKEQEEAERAKVGTDNNEGGVDSSGVWKESSEVKKEGNDNEDKSEGDDGVKSEPEPPQSPAVPTKDLLVQRLDDAIQQALNVTCHEWIAAADAVVDTSTDAAAENLRMAEEDAEETWLQHHSINDEGRARCSFHFCHKLFKDDNFLRKHLKKKHYEYCKAEQAKCHDAYMMKAWEGSGASRPRPVSSSTVGPPRLIVPDILVDCGTKYGCIPAALYHVKNANENGDFGGYEEQQNDDGAVIVDAVDPEPALWQKEQKQERIDRERRQAAEEMRQRRREESRQQRNNTPLSAPRKENFVDVDDMKEEEVVTMTFDQVELPQPKKKKKKRKLL